MKAIFDKGLRAALTEPRSQQQLRRKLLGNSARGTAGSVTVKVDGKSSTYKLGEVSATKR